MPFVILALRADVHNYDFLRIHHFRCLLGGYFSIFAYSFPAIIIPERQCLRLNGVLRCLLPYEENKAFHPHCIVWHKLPDVGFLQIQHRSPPVHRRFSFGFFPFQKITVNGLSSVIMVFQISFVVRYHLVFQPETCNRCFFLFGQFPYIMAVHFLALVPSTCGNAYFHNARIAFVVIKHELFFVLCFRIVREPKARRINVSAKTTNGKIPRKRILQLRFQRICLLLGFGARLVIVIFRCAGGYVYSRPRLNMQHLSFCQIFGYFFFFAFRREKSVNAVSRIFLGLPPRKSTAPLATVYGKMHLFPRIFIF